MGFQNFVVSNKNYPLKKYFKILKSYKDIFRMQKPSKFNVSGWNERAKEVNARYREAVSHWNIAGRPTSGPLAELKGRARAAVGHPSFPINGNRSTSFPINAFKTSEERMQ